MVHSAFRPPASLRGAVLAWKPTSRCRERLESTDPAEPKQGRGQTTVPVFRSEQVPPWRIDADRPDRIPPNENDEVARRKIEATETIELSISKRKEAIANFDHLGTSKRLQALLARSITPKGNEVAEAHSHANGIALYEEDCRALEDDWFTLLALRASLGKETLGEIDHMEGPDWNGCWLLRGQVRVRRAWIDKHEDLLRKGESPQESFLCRVSDWYGEGEKCNREFYQLILFLHRLRAAHGEEWILSERGETPDFILEDCWHNRLGAEVSEVPVSQQWPDDQRAQAKVWAALKPLLRAKGLHLRVYDPCWRQIEANLCAVQELVCAATLLDARISGLHVGFDAEVYEGPGEPVLSSGSRDLKTSSDLQEAEETLALAVLERFREKLRKKKTEEAREKPRIRPCDLILFPSGEPFVDLDRVAAIAAGKKDFAHESHFDRVWLSSETSLVALA
jgi:hypothetical protein